MKQLKALREYHGWTQKDLAKQLKVSLDSVQGWERKSNPIHPGIKNRHQINNLLVEAGIEKILPTREEVDKLLANDSHVVFNGTTGEVLNRNDVTVTKTGVGEYTISPPFHIIDVTADNIIESGDL